MSRRWLSPETASELGQLDAEAVARVRAEAWPEAANADELHDALVWLGFLTAQEVAGAAGLGRLARRSWRAPEAGRTAREPRARRCGSPRSACRSSGVVAGRNARAGNRGAEPPIGANCPARRGAGRDRARPARGLGTGHAERPCGALGIGAERGRSRVGGARGRRLCACAGASRPTSPAEEWCERRLLARIHHYTVKRLRAEIEPVAARDFLRFLLSWQRVARGCAHGRARRRRNHRRPA